METIIRTADVAVIDRGSGIRTTPLVTRALDLQSDHVTRTFADTGATVEHLSAADLMGDATDGWGGGTLAACSGSSPPASPTRRRSTQSWRRR